MSNKTYHIDFEIKVVERSIENEDWDELATYLKETFKVRRSEFGYPLRFIFSDIIVHELQNILNIILSSEKWDDNICNLLTETVKSLRNYAITDNVQFHLTSDEFFLVIKMLLKRLTNEYHSRNVILSHKYLLQLIINIMTNLNLQPRINELFYEEACHLFVFGNLNVYEMSALLYNLTLNSPITKKDVMDKIINLYGSDPCNEYLHFLLEKVIVEDYFWENYFNFSAELKRLVLEWLREQLLSKWVKLSIIGLESVMKIFLISTNEIFQAEKNKFLSFTYEILNVVRILSIMSGNEDYLKIFQSNKDILVNASIFLINFQRLGNDNFFTSLPKLAGNNDFNIEPKDHSVYDFKADLVRLIGNLCWKNKHMQELVSVADLIPVLLDCCNMDAKNPLINQWAIFAIRNLSENNIENQKLMNKEHLRRRSV